MGNSENNNGEAEQAWRQEEIAKSKSRFLQRKQEKTARIKWLTALFAKTPLGKWWIPKREELKTTKRGRGILKALQVTKAVGVIVVGLVLYGYVKFGLGDMLFPPDYPLTQIQQDEGYTRTQHSSGKSWSSDDVWYRFYEDTDYGYDADCGNQYSWCVYAMPADKDCYEIYMEFSTTESSTPFSSSVENLTASKIAPDGVSFHRNQRITLGVISKAANANYGQVDSIYCRGKG